MSMSGGTGGYRRLWIVLLALALLTPLGIILPEYFKSGPAWGEWKIESLEKMIGYAPEGMKKISDLWKAPFKDYSLTHNPGISYILSALIGILIVGGGAWFLGRWLAGRKK